jgi:hypothetical protein
MMNSIGSLPGFESFLENRWVEKARTPNRVIPQNHASSITRPTLIDVPIAYSATSWFGRVLDHDQLRTSPKLAWQTQEQRSDMRFGGVRWGRKLSIHETEAVPQVDLLAG